MNTRYEELFEEKWSTFSKVVGGIVVLLIILGLGGLLGASGYANATSIPQDQSFRVEYDRLPHDKQPFDMHIVFATSTTQDVSSIQVELDNELMNSFDVTSAQPQLAAGGVTGRSNAYLFRVLPNRAGEITLTLTPKKVGKASGTVRVENSAAVPVTFFILP